MQLPFFTIGHSTRSIEALAGLLHAAQVELVVDIRKIPMSRTNPQFNLDALPGSLAHYGIGYEHMAALGGLRGRSRGVPAEVNAFWSNQSFHNYADYALCAAFHAGLVQLLEAGRKRRSVIMCSEALWWRCHRRIVADYLIANGETVAHIMGEGRLDGARLNPGAVVRADRTVVYPASPRPAR